MNSSIINILEILKAADSLISLGFSPGYNFDPKRADSYFQELIQHVQPSTPIFSGIIILETSKDSDDFIIIDGLQRLTTLCLLLCALCDAYKGTSTLNEDAKNKIVTRYLANKTEAKLKLKGNDKNIYKKLALGEELNKKERQSNLFETYETFLKKIKEQHISATKLFGIVSRIQFMTVFTDPEKVPTREFYQSINNDKHDSSQINLITNFIDQNCGEAFQLWKSTIRTFKKLELSLLIKPFMKDFLTIQNNGEIPSENLLYNSFKMYYTKMSEYQDSQQIINNIKKYSKFYLKIIQADFEDFEIQKLVIVINENNGQDSYPYLMEVLDDMENNLIDRDTFLAILNMINSFVAERNERGNDDTMAVSFASLSAELNKMLAMENYEPDFSGKNKVTINEINHLSTFGV